jgi:penicillin-binding protein 1A
MVSKGSKPPRPVKKSKKLTPLETTKHVLSVIGTTFLTLLLIMVITVCVVAVALSVYITQFAESMQDTDLNEIELSYNSFVFAKNPYFNPDDPESEEYIELFALSADENRIWVDLEEIPQIVLDTLVAAEDKRFWEHSGVDWTRTVFATINEFFGDDRQQGGSTITQQLVRDITDDTQVNIGRKLREIFRAISFEQKYSKHDILESYLNRVAFGNTVYGIGSAARHYFDKEVGELTIAETAIIMSVLPSPVSWNPYTNPRISRERQIYVLEDCLYDQGFISYAQLQAAISEQVKFRLPISPDCRCPDKKKDADGRELPSCDGNYYEYSEQNWEAHNEWYAEVYGFQLNDDDDDLYYQNIPMQDLVDPFRFTDYAVRHNWFVDAALKEITTDLAVLYGESFENAARRLRRGGYRIYLTMDVNMQNKLEELYKNPYLVRASSRPYPAGTAARNTIQSAFVIMDLEGNVVAVAGGVGDKPGNDAFNRATQARRNIGSTIKPFGVYAPAIEFDSITYSSMLLDRSGRIDDPDRPGDFLRWPANYGERTAGGSGRLYAAWDALVRSTNTISARTVHKVGPHTVYNFLEERLQISTISQRQHLNYSALSTGSMEVRLVEVAAAYQIFGTGGIYYKPAFYSRVERHTGEIELEKDYTGAQVIGTDSAWIVNRMLRDVAEGATMPRRAQALMPNVEIIGKTGTANDLSDVLFGGLTPDYVAVVRIGFDDNRAMTLEPRGGDWWRSPTIVWGEVMSQVTPINERRNFDALRASSGAIEESYCTTSGLLRGSSCVGSRVGFFKSSNRPRVCTHDEAMQEWMNSFNEADPLFRTW